MYWYLNNMVENTMKYLLATAAGLAMIGTASAKSSSARVDRNEQQ
jgi:hypothetical protein